MRSVDKRDDVPGCPCVEKWWHPESMELTPMRRVFTPAGFQIEGKAYLDFPTFADRGDI